MSKSESRRLIIKTMLIGGSGVTSTKLIPDVWQKPVIDSVLVPSHANTTENPDFPTGFFRGPDNSLAQNLPKANKSSATAKSEDGIDLMDFFIDTAHSAELVINCSHLNMFSIAFDVPENPSGSNVNICLDVPTDDGFELAGSTTVDGNDLSAITIDGWALTDMSISLESIDGYITPPKCKTGLPFSAPKTSGIFSCNSVTSVSMFHLNDFIKTETT